MRRTDECARQPASSARASVRLLLSGRTKMFHLPIACGLGTGRARFLHQRDATVVIRRSVFAGEIGPTEHEAVLGSAHRAAALAHLDEALAEALRERGIGRDRTLLARAGA